tara:strand:- start:423 stop:563 length:141 start_codon:yes stop_codon:yes gene_type:complete
METTLLEGHQLSSIGTCALWKNHNLFQERDGSRTISISFVSPSPHF